MGGGNGTGVAERKVVSGRLEDGTALASDLVPGNILETKRGKELIVPFSSIRTDSEGVDAVTIQRSGEAIVESGYVLIGEGNTRKGIRVSPDAYITQRDSRWAGYDLELKAAGILE